MRQWSLEQLTHDPELELLLHVARAGAQEPHVGLHRHVSGGPQQRGLADAGGALEQHDPARARARLVDRIPKPRELGLAF